MQLIIPVAIKPFIKKYIAADFAVDPFVLSTNNAYGMFLFNSLQKPTPRALKIIEQDERDNKTYLQMLGSIEQQIQDKEIYRQLLACLLKCLKHDILDKKVYTQLLESIKGDVADKKILLRLRKVIETNILDPKIYSEKLPVQISENYWNKYGCIITDEKQYHFNKFVQYQFNEEFYKYVKNRIGKKGSINEAILKFRDNYGISEDELSFRTIQRAFQRRNEALTRSKSA